MSKIEKATYLYTISIYFLDSSMQTYYHSLEEKLLAASGFNEIGIVQQLLEQGVPQSAVNIDGYTPLLLAAKRKNIKVLLLLIQYGGKVNAVNKQGETALMFCAQREILAGVKALLNSGAKESINWQNSEGYTALGLACKNKRDLETVQVLLGTKQCELNIGNKWGCTALHDAAKCGHTATLAELVFNGAVVNAQDRWQNTALMYATLHGHANITEFLIQAGCDLNIVNKGNRTALHTACQNGHSKIASLIVKAGAKLDIADADLSTPLLLSGWYGHKKIMDLLLERKCNLNMVDKFGRGIVHMSARYGFTDQIKKLVYQFNMDPDTLDYNGNSPIVTALRKKQVSTIKFLLYLNCKVHRTCKIADEDVPIFAVALRNGYNDLIPILVAAGCDTQCFHTWYVRGLLNHAILKDQFTLNWLQGVCSIPVSLKQLCRAIIRQHSRCQIEETLINLGLPHKLVDYILLKEFMNDIL